MYALYDKKANRAVRIYAFTMRAMTKAEKLNKRYPDRFTVREVPAPRHYYTTV